jgi:hypothetical protein
VVGHVDRGDVEVSGLIEPSTGWSSLGFSGRLFVGSRPFGASTMLVGYVLLNGADSTTVELVRR